MRVARWSLVAVAVLFLAGCGQIRVQLTAKDNGLTFGMESGTEIDVTLSTSPSTGYHWWYDPEDLGGRPGTRVRLLEHWYVPPSGSRVGAAGKEIFRFRTEGKGTVGLRLRYIRGTASESHSGRRFGATIDIG